MHWIKNFTVPNSAQHIGVVPGVVTRSSNWFSSSCKSMRLLTLRGWCEVAEVAWHGYSKTRSWGNSVRSSQKIISTEGAEGTLVLRICDIGIGIRLSWCWGGIIRAWVWDSSHALFNQSHQNVDLLGTGITPDRALDFCRHCWSVSTFPPATFQRCDVPGSKRS